MHKFIYILILTGFVFTTTMFAQPVQHEEIGEQFDKSERFEYINELRGGNNGINWQLIDRETRLSRQPRLYQQAVSQKMNPTLLSDKFGNGSLIGHWAEKGSNNQAGRARCVDVDFDNDLLYCATDGGNVFRGTVEGENWTCLNNSLRIDNIQSIKLFDKSNDKRLFVGGFNGWCYYTDDDGQTWQMSKGLDALQKWGGIKRIAYANDDEHSIYMLCNEWDYEDTWANVSCLYYSNDLGKSFTKIHQESTNNQCMDIWAQGYDTDEAFFVKADSIFKLTNDKKTFWKIMGNANESNPYKNIDNPESHKMLMSGSGDGSYLEFAIVIRKNNISYFYVSENGGDSWIECEGTIEPNTFMTYSFATSSYNIRLLYYGSVELHTTNTNGAIWEIRNRWEEYYPDPENQLHADIPAIQFIRDKNDDELMFISTDGGLYVSTDYGHRVKNLGMNGLNSSQYYSVMTAEIDTNIIYAGAQDQGFQRANADSGGTLGFTQLFSGDFGSITSSDGGSSLWSVYPNFVLYMLDAPTVGKWPAFYRWDYTGSGWQWMTPVKAKPGNPKQAYSCGGGDTGESGNYLWSFTFTGAGINARKINRLFSERLNDLTYDNNGTIYVVSGQGSNNPGMLYKTEGDNVWEDRVIYEGENNFSPKAVVIDKTNNDVIYVAGRGYNTPGAFVSFNGGESFTEITDGLPNVYINRLALSDDGKLLFAATSTGPYVFLTWRNQWYDLTTTDSPDQDFRWVEWVEASNTARFATYGRGIWDFKVEEFTVGIEDNTPVIKYDVAAYPNPMQNNTTISFEMPAIEHGTVKIFDLEGKQINQLFKGNLMTGTNTFTWNGMTEQGYTMPNGTYLCLVSTNGYTAYTKIIIQK